MKRLRRIEWWILMLIDVNYDDYELCAYARMI